MPQTTYITTLTIGKIGTRADGSHHEPLAKLYEERHQTDTLTVASEEDGVFSVDIEGETVSYTNSSDATDTVTATGIAAAINAAADVAASPLNNVVAASSAAAVVTVTTLRKGESYTIANPVAPGSATLTLASLQSSTQTALALAIAVQSSGDDGIARPTSTSTDDTTAGLVEAGSNEDTAANDGTSGGYSAGKAVPVLEKGALYASPEDAVTMDQAVYVRRIATGTEVLGALRGAGDGTARVETVTPTAVNDQQYALRIDVDADGNGDFKSYTIAALGDGTATATELCDDYRTQLAAISALTGVVTGSGTATLILTGAAGVEFASVDLGPGVSAVVETTAGTFDTYKLRRAKWRKVAAAAGVSIVKVNRP